MKKSLESQEHAVNFLQDLYEQLEDQAPLDWDIDFDDGTLKIETPARNAFLLYYHTVMNQLWLSSTLSGAHHFHFVQDKWLSTRDNRELLSVFLADLHQLRSSIELRNHA